MMKLLDRLQQPDVVDLPDWEVADILNQPDPTLEVVKVVPRMIGIGQILTALGGDAGAAFLDALKAQAPQRSVLGYVVRLLDRGELDAGSTQVRNEITTMANAQQISQDTARALLALGEERQIQSWAQANNVHVDSRAVGLARGGKP